MPTARDPKPSAQGIPQQLGPSGGSNPIAALVAMQQESQARFDKLLQTIEQLQQQNAAEVQAAAQAGGQAATQVANQVAAGIDKENQESARQRERAEDRAFAEDQQRLNAKLQQDAAKEAASMGQAIAAAREKMMRFYDQYQAKKSEMDGNIEAYGARTDEMLAAGWFSSPEGRKELTKRVHLQDMMVGAADDHFDDRHLEAAFDLHNQNVQGLIEGDDPMDLSNLVVEPLRMPMVDVKRSGRAVAEPGSISPEKMWEMKMYGRYPANGLVFNDEENFGMPAGYEPKLMDADTMLEILSRDDYLRMAKDQSLRQELNRKNQEIVVEALDRLQPMKETYEGFNATFNPMAGAAVERAMEGFLADPNGNKFNDMGRELTGRAIAEIFGGGEKGSKMATIAMEMFDGKREMKTAEELFGAMALESAVFNIKTAMMSEFMGDSEFAQKLVKEIQDEMGEEQALLALGVPNDGIGLVNAQNVMQGRLTESFAFANRMHQGFFRGSALTQYRNDLRKYTRLADVYSFQSLREGEKKADKANHLLDLMTKEEAIQGAEEDVAALTPDEAAGQNRLDRAGLGASSTLLDSLIGMSHDIGPDAATEIASFVTGGLEAPETPNLQAYQAQRKVERERSGFSAAAQDVATYGYDRQQRAKAKRTEAAQVGESFEKGGVAGVLREQTPALLSVAHQGGRSFIGQTAIGMVKNLAGTGAAEGVLQDFRGGEGALGAGLAKTFGRDRRSNLTEQEEDQLLRESMKTTSGR